MGLADTARLAVQLDLTGNFTGGLTGAEASLGRFNSAASGAGVRTGALSGAFGTVSRAASGLGGALGHAGSQLKGLISGPLGLIGLTGGLLSTGGAIASTLSKLNDLAFGTEKLVALTGGSAESLSTLIAAAEKYGITLDKLTTTAGFYEKNVDKVISKNKELAKVLTDATGKALPFDQALLAIADVYSKSTDKAAAAAIAASLFGRSYTGLIPILALGRQGILDLETEAAKMGLRLSVDNVADFAAYRDAIRGSQEAISGLQVAIGEDLLPTIIDAANGLRSFVTDHKADIVAFFHNAVQEGRHLAGIIGDFGKAALGFWNSLPAPFRDLLVKGLVADRTVKFLFGFDPLSLGKSLFSGVIGQFFGRGATPANPLFVADVTGGGVSKLLAGAGTGLLTTLLGAAAITAIAAAAVYAAHEYISNNVVKPALDQEAANAKAAVTSASSLAQLQAQKAALQKGIADISGLGFGLGSLVNFGTIDALKTQLAAVQARLDAMSTTPNNTPSHYAGIGPGLTGPLGGGNTPGHYAGIGPGLNGPLGYVDTHPYIEGVKDLDQSIGILTATFREAPWLSKLEASWRKAGQTMHDKIAEAIKGLTGPHSAAAALFLGANLGSHGFGAGGLPQAEAILAELKKMNQSPAVVKAIHELEAKLPRLRTDAKDLAAAEKIAQDSDPKNKKLDDLNRIMADLRAHGDATTRRKVEDLIAAVKHQKLQVHTTTAVNIRIAGGSNETGRTVQRIVTRSGASVAT